MNINVSPEINKVITKKIDFYTSGKIGSYSDSPSRKTVNKSLNLFKDSTATASNVELADNVFISSNSKLTIDEKTSFNENSKITLSSIDFGDSIVEGVCQSIKLSSSSKKASLKEERKLICGKKFNCNDWSGKFNGNEELPFAKCINENDQQGLVAYS